MLCQLSHKGYLDYPHQNKDLSKYKDVESDTYIRIIIFYTHIYICIHLDMQVHVYDDNNDNDNNDIMTVMIVIMMMTIMMMMALTTRRKWQWTRKEVE